MAGRRAQRPPRPGNAHRTYTTPGSPERGEATRASPSKLSRREHQLVSLLIAGCTVKEAAACLGLSARTAEAYLAHLKRRFKETRLIPLIVRLVKQGLVE